MGAIEDYINKTTDKLNDFFGPVEGLRIVLVTNKDFISKDSYEKQKAVYLRAKDLFLRTRDYCKETISLFEGVEHIKLREESFEDSEKEGSATKQFATKLNSIQTSANEVCNSWLKFKESINSCIEHRSIDELLGLGPGKEIRKDFADIIETYRFVISAASNIVKYGALDKQRVEIAPRNELLAFDNSVNEFTEEFRQYLVGLSERCGIKKKAQSISKEYDPSIV